MYKMSLLFLSLISLCVIPCKGMQKYSEYIVTQERKRAQEITRAQINSNSNPCPYNKSLAEIDAEFEQVIKRRIILEYFVAPVTIVIGVGIVLAKLNQ